MRPWRPRPSIIALPRLLFRVPSLRERVESVEIGRHVLILQMRGAITVIIPVKSRCSGMTVLGEGVVVVNWRFGRRLIGGIALM